MATAVRTWLALGVVTVTGTRNPPEIWVLFPLSIQGVVSYGGAHFEEMNGTVCI